MNLYVIRLPLLAICFLSVSCSAMTATAAERCVLVDLQAKAGKDLIPTLDRFAEEHSLVADKSHPINPRFARYSSNEITAEVSYRIGMGRFGAELSLFRFDNNRGDDLIEAFDTLVEEEIRPKYKVTACAEVDGYELPVVYR